MVEVSSKVLLVALEMSDQVDPPLVDFCHCRVKEPVPPEAEVLLVKAVGSFPKQIVWFPEIVPPASELKIVIVDVAAFVQPFASVPVTVYVVVDVGDAETVVPEEEDKLVDGDQE